jgi:glycosyltransferase involved in cell wall biosynthesis
VPTSERLRADFTHGFRAQPQQWQADFEAGRVPEPMPYGLHRLGAYGIDLIMRPKPVRLRKAVNAAGYGADMMHWGNAFDPIARHGVDLSIAWDERTGIPIALGRSRRTPLVSGCIWTTDDDKLRWWHVAGLRRMDAIWVLSDAQIPALEAIGVARERLRHIPMGISAEFYYPTETAQVPSQIFCVGHDRHRDYVTLMDAVGRVQQMPGLDDAHLELVTPDPVVLPAHLGRLTTTYVPATDLRERYARSQVVAIALKPNLHVSGMTAILEAMACERPVVVARTPGMETYVQDDKTGILVPPGDPEAMAQAIAELLRDPERRREMGEAGRRLVLESFTTDSLNESLAAYAREVVGR